MRALWCGSRKVPAIVSRRLQKLCMASGQGDKPSPVGLCSDMKANQPKPKPTNQPTKQTKKTLNFYEDISLFILGWLETTEECR